MTAALADLPDHYVKDRAAWRRRVMSHPGLTATCRLYADRLAWRRRGPRLVSWSRPDAARVMGVSERTIQRCNRDLLTAGFLEVVEPGLAWQHQVFALVYPTGRVGETKPAG